MTDLKSSVELVTSCVLCMLWYVSTLNKTLFIYLWPMIGDECILTCVYGMWWKINRNPHSNEMRLTDRYNVHIYMPLRPVTMLVTFSIKKQVYQWQCTTIMHAPFSKTNKSKKVQVINEWKLGLTFYSVISIN
jgi:hypothetical protein